MPRRRMSTLVISDSMIVFRGRLFAADPEVGAETETLVH